MMEQGNTEAIQQTSELTFLRSKFPILKQKIGQPFPYFYQLVPKDQQLYNKKLQEFKKLLKQNSNVEQQLNIFQALVLGKVQGMMGSLTPYLELIKLFQFDNRPFWDQILKEKISSKNYGLPKQKTHLMWEVKDIEILKQMYDIQQLKKQRKLVRQYSTFYKAGHKFIQKFEKLKSQSQVSELYEQFRKVQQQQSKLNKLISGQKNKTSKTTKVQGPPVINQPVLSITPSDPIIAIENNNQTCRMQVENQQRKNENLQQQVNKLVVNQNNENKQYQIKTQNKNNKKKTEAKQTGSNKKQTKSAIDMTKYKSLDAYFKKKQKPVQTQYTTKKQQEVKPEESKTDTFISMLNFSNKQTQTDIQTLRQQLKKQKKAPQTNQVKVCYVNIVLNRSRLQFYNFMVKQPNINFTDPFEEKQDKRYDDSSIQYSEMVADSINQQMIQQQQQQQEESQSNSAIVSDSFCQYKSSHVFSSDSQSSEDIQQKKMKPQMNKPVGKWSFGPKQFEKRQKYAKYDLISLIQDAFPIMLKDQTQQSSNEISSTQKIEMYKQIHGSYTPKENLIKKINTIVQNKVSMNKLSSLVKDISEKKGSQRVLKLQIIRQLAQQMTEINPNLQTQFQKLRAERQSFRNQQMETKREQKINERDQKLQKLIIEYFQNKGEMTTHLILQHLRGNQIKILKGQLNGFLKSKNDQRWEQIKNQIKKNKLTKGKVKKSVKVGKSAKKNEQQNLMNSHRPIEQILRQNIIDMANRPKKEKKIQDGQQEDQNMMNQQPPEQMIEQQYHQPSDDESFQLKQKSKKRGKNKINKKIVKITPLLPPVRRNPKRNKKKSKRALQNEKMQDINKQQQNSKQKIESCQLGYSNHEGPQAIGNQKLNQINIQQNDEIQNKSEQVNDNQMLKNQQDNKLENKQANQLDQMLMKSQLNKEQKRERVEVSSPQRGNQQHQKIQQGNNQKTANKISINQHIQAEVS